MGSTRTKSREKAEPDQQFRAQLLSWYDAHARDLPWRRTRDPYRIWLSEIMLQQTRVAAVIEHYHEFLRRFPTVEKLAAARESSVLAAWSGLGYYRRARMLHAAAKIIARERTSQFPTTVNEWRELPGVGRYTAAAIASIAFNEPIAVVDGNVERVLERTAGEPLTRELLWSEAQALLDRNRPGDFNQALMELGATVCTPRAPACLTCPVVNLCSCRGELPATAKPAPQKKREIHYALWLAKARQEPCRDSRSRLSSGPEASGREGVVYLVQRDPDASLMAGMWELPEISPPNNHAEPVFTLRHSITVTDYTVKVWKTSAVAPPSSRSVRVVGQKQTTGQWILRSRLPKVALTGLARKILRRARILP